MKNWEDLTLNKKGNLLRLTGDNRNVRITQQKF